MKRMTLDYVIIADTHRDDETFDRLRTECLALMDEVDLLRERAAADLADMAGRYHATTKALSEAEAERDALRDALLEYGQHDASCILSWSRSGRPTADGGYEIKYGEKWYSTRPIDNTPKCTCGFAELAGGKNG